MQPFTLLIKPSGSDCNLDCTYCFYKTRSPEVGSGCQRMSDEVLEKLVKDYLKLDFSEAGFAWQGGEPTLMGLDFYKKVVELQQKYALGGRQAGNALQTNGILLDEKWCRFLYENKFLVGISIDGPERLHNYYRRDFSGAGSFDKVMRAVENCKKFEVEFNALVLLNDRNSRHPDELIDFFVDNRIKYLQFIPCVESNPQTGKIADFSVTPEQYGQFLCRIFDRWCKIGPKNLSIRDFESILSFCAGGRQTICTFDKQCSGYVVVEHTGDCFCCDFFVEPRWFIGNILQMSIEKIAASKKKKEFARLKKKLCSKCLVCSHLGVCRGGCMKDRVVLDRENFDTPSYLCEAYRRFFDYSMPRFMQMAADVVV